MDITDIAQRRPAGAARERIVSTAYALFTRRGVRAVGIDEIISQSGVAKATMYRHFPTKNDLVLAVLQRREQLWTVDLLDQHIDERAAVEVLLLLEPVVEHVEDGQQLLFGGAAAQPRLPLDEVNGPQLFAPLQHRQHEIVFGREVPVHGGFGHPGLADDLVDAHRADPAPGEQRIGRTHNSFAGRPGRSALGMSVMSMSKSGNHLDRRLSLLRRRDELDPAPAVPASKPIVGSAEPWRSERPPRRFGPPLQHTRRWLGDNAFRWVYPLASMVGRPPAGTGAIGWAARYAILQGAAGDALAVATDEQRR